MLRFRSEDDVFWSGEADDTGTGTGDARAARELIGELSLALGLREGRRDDGAGDAPELCWFAYWPEPSRVGDECDDW
jgi:hypothetical protein